MSSSFMAMAELQMQLFVLVIVGFVLTKNNTISPAGRKSLSDLLINFILPCNIICSFQAEHVNLKDGMMWWFTFVRLILIPLLVLAVLAPLPIDRIVRGTMVLISAMPAGSTPAILAAKYDGDAPFASCLIFVSTLLSLFTLPLLCLVL